MSDSECLSWSERLNAHVPRLRLRPAPAPRDPAPASRPSSPRLWQDGGTGLFMAAQNGHEAVVRRLLEHKASVDAVDQVVTRTRTNAWHLWQMPGNSLPTQIACLF